MIEKIYRKTLLYKTGVEYGDYTINHVLGCSHGCLYPCYAYMMKKRFGQVESYDDWCTPRIVDNALEILKKEVPRLKSKIKTVQLSFTTDPFMKGYPEIERLSLEIIDYLNENDIPCIVLTKGRLPEILAEKSKNNWYGITVITLDETFREKIEPRAASIKDRISGLKMLHDAGYKTWISMEPYPTPNLIDQNIEEILEEVSFVDRIVFGRTNYNTFVSHFRGVKEFYNEQAQKVLEFCKERNIECYIKNKTITLP